MYQSSSQTIANFSQITVRLKYQILSKTNYMQHSWCWDICNWFKVQSWLSHLSLGTSELWYECVGSYLPNLQSPSLPFSWRPFLFMHEEKAVLSQTLTFALFWLTQECKQTFSNRLTILKFAVTTRTGTGRYHEMIFVIILPYILSLAIFNWYFNNMNDWLHRGYIILSLVYNQVRAQAGCQSALGSH